MDLRKSWPNIVSSHVLSHWLNLSFARNSKILSKYFTHLCKKDKSGGSIEWCSVQKYRVINYGFKKILAQYSKLTKI